VGAHGPVGFFASVLLGKACASFQTGFFWERQGDEIFSRIPNLGLREYSKKFLYVITQTQIRVLNRQVERT
jgi:hypothetical protein